MSRQQRWDQRYQEKECSQAKPAEVLQNHLHLLPLSGDALDLASGLGGNAITLAKAGMKTTAIDYSAVALTKLSDYALAQELPIVTSCIDLEQENVVLPRYDVIVVSYYLHRALLPELEDSLRSDGLLFYQGFYGDSRGHGPENPDFRFQAGELKRIYSGLDILYYEEDESGEVSLIARKLTLRKQQ